MKHSEEKLLIRLKEGEEAAWRQAFDDHWLSMCYLAMQYLGDEQMARNVAGDVMSHLWEIRDGDAWSGRPFMITEFYTKAKDSGLSNKRGAGWPVETQKDRAAYYQNFCIKLLEGDSCVGWNYFKYQDNDPTDITADPSNRDSNKGLVNSWYEYYEPLTEAMQELNLRRYSIWNYFHSNK